MNRTTTGTLGMILVLVAATFLSSGMAAAQRFGGRAGGSLVPPQRVLEHLGITDPGQLELISQLREDAKSILSSLHEEQKGYRQQLKTLLESEAPNPTDVGNAVIAARNVGGEIRTTQQSFRDQFQLILTQEQLTALEEFNSNRHRRRGSRRGFGGGWDGSPKGEF